MRGAWRGAAATIALALSGCGAAYYGAAIGVIATQKDTKITDVSFPDAVPTAEVTPAFATLALSPAQVTIERDLTVFNPTSVAVVATASQTAAPFTDFEVLRVDLQPGYGESLSNRDAATNLVANDRLVVRINGDQARALTFDGADVASVGTTVAARIQAKVRALTPAVATVPAAAYQLFTCTFDLTTGTYRCRSGVPGETSEVVFEPEPRTDQNDAAPNAASQVTAGRLGLGRPHGGIEVTGAQATSVVVLNRGTDSISQGTNIDVWLSKDKVLDPKVDLHIDRFATDATIAVGEARRFHRRNGNPPQRRLLRSDFTPGSWFVLFDVATSGGEKVVNNNLLVARLPLEVHQPVDDPATQATETAAALDLVPVSTITPISAIMGRTLSANVTLTNVGAAVPAAGAQADLDLVLSSDLTFHEPAGIRDPAGVVAGLRINPTDPSVPVRVVVTAPNPNGPLTANVGNGTITVTQGTGGGIATVQSLIDVLNASSGGLVDAFSDGVAGTNTQSLSGLLTAAGTGANDVIARDLLITSKRVTFASVDRPLQTQQFVMDGTIRSTALKTSVLPRKLTPIFRARTVVPAPATPGQNPRTDIRVAANYVRIYDPSKSTFDATTGALLPTVNSDDFAALDAVTLRPVNTGSIRQGQQRVFRFELPQTGASPEQSQLLVILRTTTVDTHLDLLGPSGAFIAGSGDSALGKDPLVYTPVQAGLGGTSFYVVVSPARADESDLVGGGETFELTISVNARQKTDPALVVGVDAGAHVSQTPLRYVDAAAPRVVNKTMIPFSLAQAKAEVAFVLPQRARVKLATRPVFSVGVRSTLTRFLVNQVPTPVAHQQVLDTTLNRLVYRPTNATLDNTHVLEAGAYTLAFETSGLASDTQALRFEVEAEFIPPD